MKTKQCEQNPFAVWLRLFRNQRGYSLERLSCEVECGISYLSKVELGKVPTPFWLPDRLLELYPLLSLNEEFKKALMLGDFTTHTKGNGQTREMHINKSTVIRLFNGVIDSLSDQGLIDLCNLLLKFQPTVTEK
jgi:hypothetical protein